MWFHFGHIIIIQSHPVFSLFPYCSVLFINLWFDPSGVRTHDLPHSVWPVQGSNPRSTTLGLTRPGFEPTIYHTRFDPSEVRTHDLPLSVWPIRGSNPRSTILGLTRRGSNPRSTTLGLTRPGFETTIYHTQFDPSGVRTHDLPHSVWPVRSSNPRFITLGLTRPGIEPTTYHTRFDPSGDRTHDLSHSTRER
jgi:hypothetical protein